MKKQFWCGISGCSGHASKMGCYQHRTKLRKENAPESTFGPIESISKPKKKARKKGVLPMPLVLTPITKEKPAFDRFMEQLLPVLMAVEPRHANVTLELAAGPFFKRLLTIKFEER